MSTGVTISIILLCCFVGVLYFLAEQKIQLNTTFIFPNPAIADKLGNAESTQNVENGKKTTQDITNDVQNKENYKKLILLYTPLFGDPDWKSFVNKNIPNFSEYCGCNDKNCQITTDKDLFNISDAVIFHARDFSSNMKSRDFWIKLSQSNRKVAQVWVYFILENPIYTPAVDIFYDMFNLTFTYRPKSDIFRSGERYRKLQPNEKRPDSNINYANNKTKQVAWIVRHCGLLREKISNKLQSLGVKIFIGGGCAKPLTMKCPNRECIEERKNYKFYFSAENQFCKDYITEKYWRNPFMVNQVPIVFGGANYTKLAIPGSFIDGLSFKNPQALASYIVYLDQNDTAYNEYFKWKQNYKLIFEEDDIKGCHYTFCRLCDIINDSNYPYKDIDLRNIINKEEECSLEQKRAEKWFHQP